MYHYIDDKDFLKRMKYLCSDIINQLVQKINNDGLMEVEAHLVGSGSRNLITQNANDPIDLDYNLCIEDFGDFSIRSGREIKNYIQTQFNTILQKNRWSDCQDSTSVLTTEYRHFTKGNNTEFKIDLAIVYSDDHGWYRLIHEKTGYVILDRFYWNMVPDSQDVWEKVGSIKEQNQWKAVRDTYLEKKNMYLCRNDRNHPSFNIYVESVNEVYNKTI